MIFEVSLGAGDGGGFDDTPNVNFAGEGAVVNRWASAPGAGGGASCDSASSESDELTTWCEKLSGLRGEIEMGGGRAEGEVAALGIGMAFELAEFCVDVAMSVCLASSIASIHACASVADPAWR